MSTDSEDSVEEEYLSSGSDEDDVVSSVNNLSDELECMGISLAKYSNADEKDKMLESVLQAAWNLLQLHHSKIQELHRPDEVIYRLKDDCKILRAKVNHLKEIILKKDNLLHISAEAERKLHTKNEELSRELKKEQNEVRRLLRQLQEQQQQAARDTWRRETDTKLRTPSRPSARQSLAKTPEPMEDRLHDLVEQNLQLKRSLVMISSRLSELSYGFSSLLPKKKLSLGMKDLQLDLDAKKEPIDFVLEDCNTSCSKRLNFLDNVLQDLLGS
ncbi:uncharacterized protein LOC126419290 [Schistocerca serialis cubense]|uniref:uncharacterized protein LOC126419290 n=1 Tax=Schistocerca serialis cubense TaxID=2023355 RepID=UPI00214F4017|nr:uncharacterized protein LOC126419290 [Schistocerca serialis cubense]